MRAKRGTAYIELMADQVRTECAEHTSLTALLEGDLHEINGELDF